MKIYLCGPMTGIKDWNFPAFNKAQKQLEALGYEVENPASHGCGLDHPWEYYLKMALTQMLTCDAIALLPGWALSKGADLEYDTGKRVGIKSYPIKRFLEETPNET